MQGNKTGSYRPILDHGAQTCGRVVHYTSKLRNAANVEHERDNMGELSYASFSDAIHLLSHLGNGIFARDISRAYHRITSRPSATEC